MSFIADDEFSFLDTYRDRSDGEDESENERSHMSLFSFLGTYQEDRSDGEDESDNERSQTSSSSSFSVLEGNDEQECMYYTDADSFELAQSPAAVETPVEGLDDSDNKDEGVEGGWGELMALFGELDKQKLMNMKSEVSRPSESEFFY